MSISYANPVHSRWPHRWAVALACATFPLLWVGGLVTTTDAGMAVPDWPSTYGYNLFLYPWTTWLTAPWDLFVEHGHRLLGATVGMMTIALVALLWRSDERRWMRWLGVAALALVVFQGVLGGMRVLMNERTLAMLHGITGPLFFALVVAFVVFTSRRWMTASEPAGLPRRDKPGGSPSFVPAIAIVTCILVYLQIVIGAVLRHVPAGADPATFAMAVRFHLFLAAIVTLHIALLIWLVLSRARSIKPLAGLAIILGALVMVQLALGAATWIVKFSVPNWASSVIPTGSVAIQEGGWLQTHIITAHVAVGSLLFVTSLALALFAQRLLSNSSTSQDIVSSQLGAAV
jgi:cytochrome c oxidase assembly protein subunit 15